MKMPAGRKKLVPRDRSKVSRTAPAARAGKDRSPRMPTTNWAQVVSGMRIIRSPFVLRFRMVTTKFRPPMVKDATKKIIPTSHSV